MLVGEKMYSTILIIYHSGIFYGNIQNYSYKHINIMKELLMFILNRHS